MYGVAARRAQELEWDESRVLSCDKKIFTYDACGMELPSSHCTTVAAGKGIDRTHGKSERRPKSQETTDVGGENR